MSGILSTLLSFLLLYKYYALALIVALGATIVPFPVALILVATGAFSAQGLMNLWFVLFVAIGANIVGDLIEFKLADAYGRRALSLVGLEGNPAIVWTESYVGTHPQIAIVLTRFLGTAGALANIFAGLADLSTARFLLFDVIGNIISIAPYIVFGYYIGAHWQDVLALVDAASWALVAFIVIVLALVLWRAYRRGRSSRPRHVRHPTDS